MPSLLVSVCIRAQISAFPSGMPASKNADLIVPCISLKLILVIILSYDVAFIEILIKVDLFLIEPPGTVQTDLFICCYVNIVLVLYSLDPNF
jgi:hypothetical protein